jgi:hypothetical protein
VIVSWDSVVAELIHPIKIFVLEAMEWTGQPLSATELSKMSPYSLLDLAGHLRTMEKQGLILKTHEAPTRGSKESFFFHGRPKEKKEGHGLESKEDDMLSSASP